MWLVWIKWAKMILRNAVLICSIFFCSLLLCYDSYTLPIVIHLTFTPIVTATATKGSNVEMGIVLEGYFFSVVILMHLWFPLVVALVGIIAQWWNWNYWKRARKHGRRYLLICWIARVCVCVCLCLCVCVCVYVIGESPCCCWCCRLLLLVHPLSLSLSLSQATTNKLHFIMLA